MQAMIGLFICSQSDPVSDIVNILYSFFFDSGFEIEDSLDSQVNKNDLKIIAGEKKK